jgi:hypothetical protein
VGGREKFWGKKEIEKTLIISGRENVFFVHPQNGLNNLIFNWCIGGCWFTRCQKILFLLKVHGLHEGRGNK